MRTSKSWVVLVKLFGKERRGGEGGRTMKPSITLLIWFIAGLGGGGLGGLVAVWLTRVGAWIVVVVIFGGFRWWRWKGLAWKRVNDRRVIARELVS